MENNVTVTVTRSVVGIIGGDSSAQKVMWFSRHDMSPEQSQALVNKLGGGFELVKVDGTIPNAFAIKEYIDECDVIAIVAPIHIQEQVLRIAGNKPVIMALSRRELVPDENGGESKAVFIFEKWERLLKIVVEKEDF